MAKTEIGRYMNRLGQRTRKKKIVGQGNDNSVKVDRSRPQAGSSSNASFVDFGGGVQQAAEGHRQEQDRKYMKRMYNEQQEIKRDKERVREQKITNREALGNIANEIRKARYTESPIDQSSVMDFAQDYIPMDDKLGKAERQRLNKNKAKQFVKNRK